MKRIRLFSIHVFYLIICNLLLLKLSALDSSALLIHTYNVETNCFHFPDDGKKISIEEKLKKYEGTFQIQIKNPRLKPNIPYNIDKLIETNRKADETVYIIDYP